MGENQEAIKKKNFKTVGVSLIVNQIMMLWETLMPPTTS